MYGVIEQRSSDGAVKKYYHNAMSFLLDSMNKDVEQSILGAREL